MTDFWAAGMSGLLSPVDSQNVPQSLRQRIALAMLMKKNAYPKTLGEGLASIGDSLGDTMVMRRLEAQAAQAEQAGKSAEDRILTGPPTGPASPAPSLRSSYAPTDETQPEPATASVTPPRLAAVPLPVDQQQSDEPGAPVRMPTAAAVQDWRSGVARPNIPPGPATPPPQPSPPAAPRPMVPPPATGGPQASLLPVSDATDFSAQSRSPPLPPPGAPVVAAGGEPSAEERSAGRDMLTRAIVQQRGPQAVPPGPTPPAQPPAPAVPPPVVQSAPQPPQVRPVPPPVQPETDPGYVPAARPERPPPPTTTPLMQRMAEELRNTPPAYREAVQARFAPLIAQEQARLTAIHEADKTARANDYAVNLERERLLATQAQRRQTYATGSQSMIQQPGGAPAVPAALGTDASPQRTGRPDIGQPPLGVSQKVHEEKMAPIITQKVESVSKAVPALQQSLELINRVRSHPGLELGTGTTGAWLRDSPMSGDAYAFGALMKQIQGKNFLAGYETLKGAGAIGEKEGAKGEQAQAAIDPNMPKERVIEGLNYLEKTMRRSVEEAQRAVNKPVTAWQKTPDDPYAPDIGQTGTREGQPAQYIGGDPADDSSYRKPR
jgi:hypothetical protein